MKRTCYILIFILSAGVLFANPSSNTDLHFKFLQPESFHPRVEQLTTHLLMRNHYKKTALDDSLSSKIFDEYIKTLDFNRSHFLASDIEKFEKYRYLFDDFLQDGNLDVAFEIFNQFQIRLDNRMEYAIKRLHENFDFTIDEDYYPDRENAPWATTEDQLNKIWDMRLKSEALNLKLTGKEWDSIVEILEKRYKNIQNMLSKYQSEDVFQLYMNSFAATLDPHTNYFSPKASDDFKIQMSLSLEGIGAVLRNDNDYTQVVEIVPGGPADKTGRLHPNDRITGVAQDTDGEMVDVIGWRVDDVVQLIRGPKASTVRLQVLPVDADPHAPPITIKIVRDKIKLEDRAAKSDTLELMHNGKPFRLGIIDVPAFYFDYEAQQRGDKSYKSTTRDVERLIKDLKLAGIDGLIIDLRKNGGGFLSEAVELSGLFIKDGPVVQVRDSGGMVKVERDTDPEIAYDGPLAVIVDQFSASASEIFAAAIQDYGRGIVLGSQTFGKGTVQNAIDLNRFFPHSTTKYGQLKLTIAKFYRINGGSTQHIGVLPDITLPSRYKHEEIGESSQQNALLWDKIAPVTFRAYNSHIASLLPDLKRKHQIRISGNPDFKNFMDEIERYKKKREQNSVSLLESRRLKELEETKTDKNSAEDDEDLPQEKKDLILFESAHILSDFILLSHTN
ncbi:MAG: carboxy terminal-processing peptidase [Calditrichaceae bacterium]